MKIKKKFTDAILFKDGLEIEILDNITSLFGIKLKSNNAVIFGFLNAGKIKNLRDSKIIIKYIERHSAAGQLPGSSNLEENVHSQKNSIIEKKITRQISPLLKLNKFNMDIELNLLLESGNSGYPSDSLAMNCAMILSYISGIIDFPYYTGRFCSGQSGIQIEPGFKEINRSKFSVLISWTSEKLIFLEASGREFSEYQIENIKRIIETGQSGYFEFLKDLKNESGIDLKLNGVLSEDADFDIKRSIENIILANKELIEGIYVYDSYKTRIEELTKLSSILLKNAELSTDINIKNFDEFKNYYFYSFYRILLNIVKENLNQKKRLYDDYANKITDIEIEITKNKNTSVCRINRKVTDAIVSVTSLRQKEENSEEGQQVKRTKNKIEKFVKINDDVDFRSESKFYNISNFFGNNINVLLGDRILSDEYKPLRSGQIETAFNKIINFNKLLEQNSAHRMVTEYISSDGSEISVPINAINILKYFHPEETFNNVFYEDAGCLEFAYLIEQNYLILEPVFIEEAAADLRICIIGDERNIKYLNIISNCQGVETSKLIKAIKECKTILKNFLRTLISGVNKNRNNLNFSVRF